MSKSRRQFVVWLTASQIAKLAKHQTVTLFRKGLSMVIGSKEMSKQQQRDAKKQERIRQLRRELQVLEGTSFPCPQCPPGSRVWPTRKSLAQHKSHKHCSAEKYQANKVMLARARAKSLEVRLARKQQPAQVLQGV